MLKRTSRVAVYTAYSPGPGFEFVAYVARAALPNVPVAPVLFVDNTCFPVPPNAFGPIAAGPGEVIPNSLLECSEEMYTLSRCSLVVLPNPYRGIERFCDSACTPTAFGTRYCPAPGCFFARSRSGSRPRPAVGNETVGSVTLRDDRCGPMLCCGSYAVGPGPSLFAVTFAAALDKKTFCAASLVAPPKLNASPVWRSLETIFPMLVCAG
mmetsp:Transcript_10000/g.36332  ORF Transcript_10000/g.36332 Transcript_10000/m.36332 type:complete len:210 (+) Transcript_10000:468-1097(+)